MSDLLTIAEVAALLHCSEETVSRRFTGVKGVIDLGSPETPRKRRYRLLRIPRSVVEKYVLSKGGRINIEVPPARKPATTRKVKPPTEDELVRDLAALTSQHGNTAQKMLDKIAERVRLLRFVPQEQWQDVVWVSSEDEEDLND
jgi:hypothetical protein